MLIITKYLEQKTCEEVHALTVAHFLIHDGIGKQKP